MKNNQQLREALLSLPTPSADRPGRYIRVQQELELRLRMINEANVEDGVLRWDMGNLIPACVLRDAGLESWPAQDAALDLELDAIRERMANHVPSSEELFEMRAAFGEGAEVVNVLTGRRTTL
jgi:hypothetical protein